MPSPNTGNPAVDNIVGEWFAAIGTKQNYRTMVYYAGNDGDTFEFNFDGGYINRSDIKAFMVKDDTRERFDLTLTFVGPNTVKTNRVVPIGWTILIYRDTPKAKPLAAFQDGAIINAVNLDRNANQAIFSVAEMVDRFDSTVTSVESALKDVYEANQKAEQAIRTANSAAAQAASADAKADRAIVTANAADAKADSAIGTANSATSTANQAKAIAEGIDAQVKQANATAAGAVSTANEAKQIAQGIDGKATQAMADASTAKATANAATATANEAKGIAQGIDAKATQAQRDAKDAQNVANEALNFTKNPLPGSALRAITLVYGQHLNSVVAEGHYGCDDNGMASLDNGYPEPLAGHLTVTRGAGIQQRYHVYNTAKVYVRAQYAKGAFTAWAREFNTHNPPTPEEVGAIKPNGRYAASLTMQEYYANGWFRTSGDTGWYSEKYGGGMYMRDVTYIRTYGGKRFHVEATAADAISTAGGMDAAGTVVGRGGVYDGDTRVFSAKTNVAWGYLYNVPAYAARWPTWDEVLNKPAVAMTAAGGVGSYALLLRVGGPVNPGQVVSGGLYYTNAEGTSNYGAAAGSWQAMGGVRGDGREHGSWNTTLFVRVG
ncbi:tail fiber protein [Aeromonas phage phiAS7]|uniref:Putative tail fiber protein n=1 Tax=Aeromonas phage phiAS7 TaxID=1141132 RepID=H6UK37_9CAUD|nr:tail fiber protein [Aeromonas phage phiAS7]AEZ65053.1 putative tail fiber protein [Aeromonas phage phiAS7]